MWCVRFVVCVCARLTIMCCLFVVSCLLFCMCRVSCVFFVVCCLLFAMYRLLMGGCCWAVGVCCVLCVYGLMSTVRYVLCARCFLLVAYCGLLVGCCLLIGVRCFVCVAWCLLFDVC